MKPKPKAAVRVKFPLDPITQPDDMAVTAKNQCGKVQACPAYLATSDIGVLTTAMSTQADDLTSACKDLANHETEGLALVTVVNQKALKLQLTHESLHAALNIASGSDQAAALAWTGEIETRTAIPASTAAPENAELKTTAVPGSTLAKCKTDRSAVCYLFQIGADPTNPDAWPAPVISSGSRHYFTGLTIGQKSYVRIAIVRRNGGQGVWSNVMVVTVR